MARGRKRREEPYQKPGLTASGSPPYPEAWIAEVAAGQECSRLVYKHGCHAIRTGEVAVTVFLDERGEVRDVRAAANSISLDPALVEQCLRRSIKQRKWRPPQGVSRSFTVRLLLRDRC